MNHIHGGVEAVVHKRMLDRAGGIFADDECDGTMGVDVIGAILGIILNYQNRSVYPVGAVRDGFDHAPEREIIIRHRSSRTRMPGRGAVSVIIGQIQKDEVW